MRLGNMPYKIRICCISDLDLGGLIDVRGEKKGWLWSDGGTDYRVSPIQNLRKHTTTILGGSRFPDITRAL